MRAEFLRLCRVQAIVVLLYIAQGFFDVPLWQQRRDVLVMVPEIMPDEANNILQDYFDKLQQAKGKEAKAEGEKFLAENKKKEGVVALPSGLQYKILTAGNGPKPKASDTVKCHYEGRLINGTVFDSSIRRNEPAEFPVSGVIAGWVEALQLMPVGSKWQLYIPSELAYGTHGAGQSIGPNQTLIFDVELLAII